MRAWRWLRRQNTLPLPRGRFLSVTRLAWGLPAVDTAWVNEPRPPWRHGRGKAVRVLGRVSLVWGRWWPTDPHNPGYTENEKVDEDRRRADAILMESRFRPEYFRPPAEDLAEA